MFKFTDTKEELVQILISESVLFLLVINCSH